MEIPFNSANKWQMSIHEMSGHQEPQLLMFKGAPDVLLAKCTEFMDTDGTVHPIDSEFLKRYKVAYEMYGGQVGRVCVVGDIPLKFLIVLKFDLTSYLSG